MASGSGKYKSYNTAVKAGYISPANKRKAEIPGRSDGFRSADIPF